MPFPPRGTGRYAAHAIVFGSSFQSRLSKLNLFLVGSGNLAERIRRESIELMTPIVIRRACAPTFLIRQVHDPNQARSDVSTHLPN